MGHVGYDVIYVDDISATTSPEAAYGMVRYNSNLDGKSPRAQFILAIRLRAEGSSQFSFRLYWKQQQYHRSIAVKVQALSMIIDRKA